MNSTAANMAGQAAMSSGLWSPNTQIGPAMFPQAPMEPRQAPNPNTQHFSVEKVDNGFIIRSGKYTKICNNMEELAAQFVAVMVEKQLDK